MNQLSVYTRPSVLCLPPTAPSHPSRSSGSTEMSSLCYAAASHLLLILYNTVYVSVTLLVYPILSSSPSLCPRVCPLHLHLHSCPANRLFRATKPIYHTIFLDSIYMYYIRHLFFSFWLTSLCMIDSGFIHIITDDPISFLFMDE